MNAQAGQDNQPTPDAGKEPEAEHSPWTEPFHLSLDTGTFDRVSGADQKADQQRAEHSEATPKSEDRPSDDATHDALSTIFHGH
ncbi:MAG TPA: hypothetical protein VKQ72_22910 [Aggregatilineales bacterium]|nr:hypothetical protein [Aggregatilineales bacterium]